jgi:hypothetical protein
MSFFECVRHLGATALAWLDVTEIGESADEHGGKCNGDGVVLVAVYPPLTEHQIGIRKVYFAPSFGRNRSSLV